MSWRDDPDFDPHEYDDAYPVRRAHRYSCSDRMCGALDCANCHPELQGTHSCDCCGAERDNWDEWLGDDGNLCPDCADMVQCEECGEWVEDEKMDDGICPHCVCDLQSLVH